MYKVTFYRPPSNILEFETVATYLSDAIYEILTNLRTLKFYNLLESREFWSFISECYTVAKDNDEIIDVENKFYGDNGTTVILTIKIEKF
jgi:hypothetical protein